MLYKKSNKYGQSENRPLIDRIKCILISAVLITLCVFSGCVYYNGSPRHGHWETPDQSIVIWYENFDASYITLNGTQINCNIGNEHGSDDVWFEAAFDIPDLCKKGEILAEGKTIRLDDNEWVIRIDGIEYHLFQIAGNSQSGQSGGQSD